MKKTILLFISVLFFQSVFSQVSVMKMVGGKYAKEYKTGFGAFWSFNFPLNEANNRVLTLDVIDFGLFATKTTSEYYNDGGFASIKVGYRYIFSEESVTGFFVEPQAGFALTAVGPLNEAGESGKGLALALTVGYALGVGQRGNNFTFGLKYEAGLTDKDMSVHTVGLRVAYHFSMFGRRNDR